MLRIEPGLFEWGQWFRPKLPTWMHPDEFVAQGYPADVTYTPIMPAIGGVSVDETLVEYYNRSHNVVRAILDRHRDESKIFHWSSLLSICAFGWKFYSLLFLSKASVFLHYIIVG